MIEEEILKGDTIKRNDVNGFLVNVEVFYDLDHINTAKYVLFVNSFSYITANEKGGKSIFLIVPISMEYFRKFYLSGTHRCLLTEKSWTQEQIDDEQDETGMYYSIS